MGGGGKRIGAVIVRLEGNLLFFKFRKVKPIQKLLNSFLSILGLYYEYLGFHFRLHTNSIFQIPFFEVFKSSFTIPVQLQR